MTEKKLNGLKKLNNLLNIVMSSFGGVFIGHAIYVFWEYRKYPGLYAIQSAPWYTSILVWGVFVAAVLLIAIIVKRVIKKMLHG